MTNREFSNLLHQMSAAYQILNENRFKIIAYDRAADSIEHLTSELKDLWDDNKLGEIPGVGKSIAMHIDEYFRTGKIKHFDETLSKLPKSIYPLLLVPGIGPKKAHKLVTELHLTHADTVLRDLEQAAKDHKIAPIEGFGAKSEEVILSGIETYKRGAIKENRMSLPDADIMAAHVLTYLRKHKAVKQADYLGSLRRQVSTIGDLDIAAVTDDPQAVVDYFIKYPHEKIIDHGEAGGTLLLHTGRQVDLRVQKPEAYGAMLQYFTGSKHHNIKLRTLALEKGLSLNEHGIKHVKTGKLTEYATEEGFYKAIGLPWIPPELREDRGEIEAALAGKLPHVVEVSDIKGDLHMHTKYEFPTSHDIGQSPVTEHLDLASTLGYEYIGISDHNPKVSDVTDKEITQIMKKRYEWYKEQHEKWKRRETSDLPGRQAGVRRQTKDVELFVMCEVDILTDGRLALPDSAFEYVDAVVVSLHSAFTQSREEVTKRIVSALTSHPKVRIFGHPTGRLLSRREGVDANWSAVMDVCKERDIALEINAYPDRLDLPDTLVFDAVKKGIKLVIDTDSHAVDQMHLMKYGVAVARRGWATKSDIINTRALSPFSQWLLRQQ